MKLGIQTLRIFDLLGLKTAPIDPLLFPCNVPPKSLEALAFVWQPPFCESSNHLSVSASDSKCLDQVSPVLSGWQILAFEYLVSVTWSSPVKPLQT